MTVMMPTSVARNYEEFIAEAGFHLDRAYRNLDSFIQGPLEGRWHPNGFMVFNVEDIADFGLVRLHVWPESGRQALKGHPVIHRHTFHLLSRVILGTYREVQYAVSECAESDGSAVPGWVVVPPNGDGIDRLAPDSAHYHVSPRASVDSFGAGSSHQMPAGDYHATSIRRWEECWTLALLSRPIPGETDHLVGRGGLARLENARQPTSVEQVESIRLRWTRQS